MANFLINLFKAAPKSDGLRTTDTPEKYTKTLAKLNASGANKNGTTPTSVNSAVTPANGGRVAS